MFWLKNPWLNIPRGKVALEKKTEKKICWQKSLGTDYQEEISGTRVAGTQQNPERTAPSIHE
jgi:hypothetical protein